MKGLLVLLFLAELAYSNSQELLVETFAYPPLADEKDGFINDVVEEVAKIENMNLKVVIFPYPRFVNRMKNNKGFVKIGSPYDIDLKLPDKYFFIPFVEINVGLFFIGQGDRARQDLTGKTVAVIRKARMEIASSKKLGLKYVETSNLESSIKMLGAGRVDFVACIPISCYKTAKKIGLRPSEVGIHTQNLFKTVGGFLISKRVHNSMEIRKKLERGMRSIMRRGQFGQILGRYFHPFPIPGFYSSLQSKALQDQSTDSNEKSGLLKKTP